MLGLIMISMYIKYLVSLRFNFKQFKARAFIFLAFVLRVEY